MNNKTKVIIFTAAAFTITGILSYVYYLKQKNKLVGVGSKERKILESITIK